MPTWEFTALLWLASLGAGLLGALTGLGGGVVIVPLLTLAFGVDLHYAIGASLVTVICTSSGAAAAYVKEGFSNVRIGLFLEIATTFGALFGAYIAARVSSGAIAIVFGIVLMYSAVMSNRQQRHDETGEVHASPLATKLKLNGDYPGKTGKIKYNVTNVPIGFGMMFGAGTLSGLLGIGSGVVKVLAMDQAMHIPFKVSTTTSNFMIGVTAAASAGVYLSRGYIDPVIATPVVIGVLAGSMFGAKILVKAKTQVLRRVFAIVIGAVSIEMIYKGITGKM
jgi:uncharacterized membrane protein YfcA